MDTVDRLIAEGSTFGIHVVAAVSRLAELRVKVRGGFGSRVWLRPTDIHDVTDLPKPRLAAAIPADRPGRGMIAQNYVRAGVEPVGLHTLMARPAIQASDAEDFDSRSVAEAVSRVAGGFTVAPKVRRLPTRLSQATLGALARGDDRWSTSIVWALSETERPVFLAPDRHLVIAGKGGCGRTTACATVLAEIARLYALDEEGVRQERPGAQVWLVDPRRQLHAVLGPVGVHRFASTVDSVKARMVELAGVLAARLPRDDPDGGGQIAQRSWQGPEIFLVIDDGERMPGGFDSPFAPIEPFVQAGRDVGLHIVYTHSFGAFSTQTGANPVLRMLRTAFEPMLIMDSDPDPGYVQGRWKGHPMVAGRGFLMNSAESGETGLYVQVADTAVPGLDSRLTQT
jgi:DNA segregation ATPase FtsK/SpoIIIE-like protein